MAIFSLIGDLMKSAPRVPGIQPIDPSRVAADTIAGNIKNMPRIKELAELSQQLGVDLFGGGIDSLFGGGTFAKIQDQVQSGLKGELSKVEQDLIERRSAEFATSRGYSGAGIHANATTMSMGLASRDVINQTMDSVSKWFAISQAGTPSFGNMFTTVPQGLEQANRDREAIFNRNWVKNQLDSAHQFNNIMGDYFNTFDEQLIQLGSAVLGGAAGGMMGGGGGMGGMMGGGGGGGGSGPPKATATVPQMSGLQYMQNPRFAY